MFGVSLKDRCRNSDVGERCGLKEDVGIRVEKRHRSESCLSIPDVVIASATTDGRQQRHWAGAEGLRSKSRTYKAHLSAEFHLKR
ncbi:hypothetical protein EVAR_67737_1 [Eumeta japonica]|uniref:Uncharacterized protein n=1 Tax=Eumeta variegata TaxID=151549 RepID=A0A4C1ZCU5_EUMVA|nr:hypothetical protein EVAR_67737_1 [Eumeta japonica]